MKSVSRFDVAVSAAGLLPLALGAAIAVGCSSPTKDTIGGSGTGGTLASGGAGGRTPVVSGTGGEAPRGGQSGSGGGTSPASGGTGGGSPPAGTGGTTGTAGSGGTASDTASPPVPDMAPGTTMPNNPHEREVLLDTTATGAAVMVDVPKYPVSVLLGADNFDFAQAKPNGEDLRFTAAGKALPFEIEFWDAKAKVAAIWVKVDVKGNAKQSFTMTWGDQSAASASDSQAVFDIKDGFIGVWHLSDPASATPGGYKDVTANQSAATGVSMTAEGTAPGRMGNAVSLDHAKGQWLEVPAEKSKLYANSTRSTWSIWFKPKSVTVAYQAMFTQGKDGFRLHYFGLPRNPYIIEICVSNPETCPLRQASNATDVKPGAWYHVVAIGNNPKIGFYINGVLEAEGNAPGTWKLAVLNVGIGNNPTHGVLRSFDGLLDEARVLNVPKDINWAKLEYESQKEGQKFLTFGPVK